MCVCVFFFFLWGFFWRCWFCNYYESMSPTKLWFLAPFKKSDWKNARKHVRDMLPVLLDFWGFGGILQKCSKKTTAGSRWFTPWCRRRWECWVGRLCSRREAYAATTVPGIWARNWRFDKNFGLKVGLIDFEWLNRGLFVSYPVILGERLAGRQGWCIFLLNEELCGTLSNPQKKRSYIHFCSRSRIQM